MPSAMQPVFPLAQDPPAQLVILPTEPPTHGTPHTLGEPETPTLCWGGGSWRLGGLRERREGPWGCGVGDGGGDTLGSLWLMGSLGVQGRGVESLQVLLEFRGGRWRSLEVLPWLQDWGWALLGSVG